MWTKVCTIVHNPENDTYGILDAEGNVIALTEGRCDVAQLMDATVLYKDVEN